MPMIENLDMDRFSATARHNASMSASGVKLRLDTCDSLEDAQTALAAMLWHSADGSRTALCKRLTRLAARITQDYDIALDLVNEAFITVSAQWKRVSDVEGYMYRALRNMAMDVKRKARRRNEQLTDSPEMLEEITVARTNHRPIHDGARASMDMLLEMANPIERKIIKLSLRESWDGLRQFPTIEAIADELGMSAANVLRHMKNLGLRAGLWTNERKWFKIAAGTRRSAAWFNQQRMPHVWSVLAWFCQRTESDFAGFVPSAPLSRWVEPDGDGWLERLPSPAQMPARRDATTDDGSTFTILIDHGSFVIQRDGAATA